MCSESSSKTSHVRRSSKFSSQCYQPWLARSYCQPEGTESTDEDRKEGMHSWLTVQLDFAPGDTGKHGIDLQALTSLITDFLWPSADLNVLADPWKTSCFVCSCQGTVGVGCSQWGCPWAQRLRRGSPPLLMKYRFISNGDHSFLRGRRENSNLSSVWWKVWSLTPCISLADQKLWVT